MPANGAAKRTYATSAAAATGAPRAASRSRAVKFRIDTKTLYVFRLNTKDMRTRERAFLRLGQSLATRGEEPVRLATLRAKLEVSPSTLHGWVQQLRFQRALTQTNGGYQVDRARLLAFYTANRIARIAPITEIPVGLSAQRLSDLLRREGIPHALAMMSAANEWAFFEPRRTVELYLDRRIVPRVRDLLPAGDGMAHFFHENLDDLPVATRARRPVTDLFLTVIDSRAHPEGGAHADFVDRNILQRAARP